MVHICGLTLYVCVQSGVMMHICGLTLYVCVHSGVVVAHLWVNTVRLCPQWCCAGIPVG